MGRGSLPKKAPWLKKENTVTLCSNFEIAEGGDVVVDEDVDERVPSLLITSSCDSVMVSEV